MTKLRVNRIHATKVVLDWEWADLEFLGIIEGSLSSPYAILGALRSALYIDPDDTRHHKVEYLNRGGAVVTTRSGRPLFLVEFFGE